MRMDVVVCKRSMNAGSYDNGCAKVFFIAKLKQMKCQFPRSF